MSTQSRMHSAISPVMKDILEWSQSRPAWQRDAFRRLVVNGAATDDDVAELAIACLAEHKALDESETPPTLQLLSRSHVPTTSVADSAVRIRSIAEIKHTNALAEGQQLDLSPEGLTIIYGDNGSGKTGYARILKHSGRSRRRDSQIRSNVFAAAPNKPASATIHCEVGSEVTEIAWKDGDQPEELASVSSFDADCATVHVNDPNTIDFTPFGLDLFSKLVDVCKRVKAKIGERVHMLEESQAKVVANPACRPTTKVGRILFVLNANTRPDVLAEACHVSDSDTRRIEQIESMLKSDPESQAKAFKTQISVLQRVLKELQLVQDALSSTAVSAFAKLAEDAATKRAAAELHATQLAGKTPLGSLGSSPWMELWKAAKKYSELAYPGRDFPAVEDNAVCVLCQQELEPDAQTRLKGFDSFVKDESERLATEAEARLNAVKTEIQRLFLDDEKWKSSIGETLADHETIRDQILADVSTARTIREQLLNNGDNDDNCTAALQSKAVIELTALIEEWTSREEELRTSINTEERQSLKQELEELQDKQWLNDNVDAYIDEINRLAELGRLKKAEKATNHTAISTKGGKLATTYVTDELTATFAKEVKRLCGRDVKVSLGKGKSRNGVATYVISLDSTQDAKPHHVLSEGEFRCIAIAGFLTELSTSENLSAVVLDDPVSSLGHEWRSHIAARLVEEAKTRQVVIFSHDMFFVDELARIANDQQVAVKTLHVARSATGIGLCRPNLPWFGATTFQRIERLRSRLVSMESEYGSASEAERLEISKKFFSHLRETVERAVEREFIGGCLRRFENYIPVSKLWMATAFDDSDAEKLHHIHRRCSNGIDGHDHSTSAQLTSPHFNAMIGLLDDLKDLIESVHYKRDQLKTRRRRNRRNPGSNTFTPDF